MRRNIVTNNRILCGVLLLLSIGPSVCRGVLAADYNKAIATAGVGGGFVVVIGCEDIGSMADIDNKYVVQVLGRNADAVQKARAAIAARGRYGRISVAQWDGKIFPYVDNLVNLVIDTKGELTAADKELLRVLAPLGVSMINGVKTVNPFPPEMDEWHHFLHDADNNAVANDTVVAAPRSFQWLADPLWMRSHGDLGSISAMVTAEGRIFTVVDTVAPTSSNVPARWRMIARDAFNGLKLWERDIDSWSDLGRGIRRGPVQIKRLLVTDGSLVYLPLGNDKPVTALDAVTGEVVHKFAGTKKAEELLLTGGKLVVLSSADRPYHTLHYRREGIKIDEAMEQGKFTKSMFNTDRVVTVIDLKSRETLFSRKLEDDASPIPQTIASDGRRIYYDCFAGVTALDLNSGRDL